MPTQRVITTTAVLLGVLLSSVHAADETIAGLKVPGEDTREFGVRLQRTMQLLAGSTAEHPATVRILCYGQSIMGGGHVSTWLTKELHRRYPTAHLVLENRAIGGYTSPQLCRTAPADIVPFRPDLVVLHVYEGEDDGTFADILNTIRQHTNADLLTWTHHVDAFNVDAYRDAGSAKQRVLVQRADGEVAEVRTLWQQTLALNHIAAQSLLRDQIHLNDQGGALLSTLVDRHVQVYHGATPAGDSGVTHLAFGAANGPRLHLTFTGNRVDLCGHLDSSHPGSPPGNGRLRILVDGHPPSADPATLTTTRCSTTPGAWFPTINRVTLGAAAKPETWTMTITGTADPEHAAFTVSGSVTGADGAGHTDQPFTSTSGAIRIEPRDITLAKTRSVSGKPLPDPVIATWEVQPMALDQLAASTLANDVPHTVWLAWTSGRHELDVIAEDGGTVPIDSAVIYDPAARR